MCDNASYTLQSSIFIWALSIIPSSILPYFILALVCASLVIYTVHHMRPSTRLSRLNDALAGATEILARAKSACLRDLLDLAEAEACLLQCERQVRELQTSTLLIMEAENQRKLAKHINESRQIVNTVVRSPSLINLRAAWSSIK
ncbi:hypothetical protein FB451DRAFT_1174259 [Mycena latifolia]|nr:hypothetical protein FB451DRAFT_1174259 [Mycena latifolia]